MNRRMSWGHYVLEGGAYGFQVSLIDHRKEKLEENFSLESLRDSDVRMGDFAFLTLTI